MADVLLATGSETGAAPDPSRLLAVRRAVPQRPVWVASGVAARTAPAFAEADGFIAGSAFKRGGRAENPVEASRVAPLVRTLKVRKRPGR